MADSKPKRKNWIVSADLNTLSCPVLDVNLDTSRLTDQGKLFTFLYGLKQIESDSIAGKGPEYTDLELKQTMLDKFDFLCNPDCEIVRTDAGFTLRDPNASKAGASALTRAQNELRSKMEFREKMIAEGISKAVADKLLGDEIKALKTRISELEDK